jgi:hypothetical protein
MTIKLPLMPDTEWNLYMLAKDWLDAWTSTDPGYTAEQMEAYAREAVRLNMAPLSDEQIDEIAEPFGFFMYGDAQGDKRTAFARAIESAIKGD